MKHKTVRDILANTITMGRKGYAKGLSPEGKKYIDTKVADLDTIVKECVGKLDYDNGYRQAQEEILKRWEARK